MSSSNPPYPYYNGITYNPAFFNQSTNGITQLQANLLYLQKTVPDSATAVESFLGGVVANQIDVPTSNGTLNLGITSTTGTTNISTASGRTGAINIGTGATTGSVITMGGSLGVINLNGSSQVFSNPSGASFDANGGSLQIANSVNVGSITMGQNLTTGTIYIGANASGNNVRTGIIHIGDSNNLTTGAVHINNGTANASNTQIMNGSTTSGICNIMTGAGTTGTLNMLSGSSSGGVVNIGTGVTGVGAVTTAVNIATGTTSGIVSIGNANNSVTFGGPLNLFYNPSLISSIGLGYKFNGTSTGITATTTGVISNFSKIIIPSNGVWLLFGNTLFISPGVQIQLSISSFISSATVGFLDLDCLSNMVGIGYGTTQVSRVINTSLNPSTWYLMGTTGTGTTITNVVFYAVRIG
jgi:hypothetical protein